ncbi:hypothetical protein BCV69DRAFT_284765 [Microstroma glucosiphilum]|uniref:Small ribosomal subunit protein uS5m n=1 Tax=Pseudomicrostroma glucosiphilum TaxID=1684307 RepID=A0A316U044_9BASI|nr:hypothetical protein BCV69DRAFT_284765 [Pseudomicrostroma glucosiphilum]PWN18782.1 hypothetical protein BCV69DRAFT_284765 [Pseudomicrostroma glucosiphilum]
MVSMPSSSSLRRCFQGLSLSAHASSSSLRPTAARFTTSSRLSADEGSSRSTPPASESSSPSPSSPASSSKPTDPASATSPTERAPIGQPSRSNRTKSQPEVLAEGVTGESGGQNTANTGPPRRVARSSGSSSSRSEPSQPMNFSDLSAFPSILHIPHPIIDSGEVLTNAPSADSPYGSTVTIYNNPKHFRPSPMSASDIAQGDVATTEGGEGDAVENILAEETPLGAAEIRKFHRHILVMRRVVRMTGKGKIPSMSAVMVVGNGKGMVGFGMGKDENASTASQKAYKDAVKKMDFVKRFENRTIHRSVVGEWGATKVHMRPRPPGFGLRVPPAVHAIARSSGITDLSASITGSTNPINVCKAVLSALLSGAGPTGMGDGLGGSARRQDLGEGAKTLEDLEIERGRRYRVVRS